ncbi:MAG: ABC transporter substrate-binding protein [Alphaproteobacteria bacterium]|nr:ABC transporter substrate-binding protein [Alphaproteobacteria bacterium]
MKAAVAILLVAAALAACDRPAGVTAQSDGPRQRLPQRPAQRIVSIDFCADQFLLRLVERDRILAVSPDADAKFSYMREAAQGLRKVRPNAEDVLALKPDLIVRSYGGGPRATAFFERAGTPVLNVGWAPDVASTLRVTMDVAAGLGATTAGEAVVDETQARLDAIDDALASEDPERRKILYLTTGGVTTGPGSLIHDIIARSGHANYMRTPGWRSIPLEDLAGSPPDAVAAGFFDTPDLHLSAWSAARHPIARRLVDEVPTVRLDGAWTACGGWFVIDAIEALAGADSGNGPS